jgi:hypothetical protein
MLSTDAETLIDEFGGEELAGASRLGCAAGKKGRVKPRINRVSRRGEATKL